MISDEQVMREIVGWVADSWPLRQVSNEGGPTDEARCYYCHEYNPYDGPESLHAFPHREDCVWRLAQKYKKER
jgi:hypothetical protein